MSAPDFDQRIRATGRIVLSGPDRRWSAFDTGPQRARRMLFVSHIFATRGVVRPCFGHPAMIPFPASTLSFLLSIHFRKQKPHGGTDHLLYEARATCGLFGSTEVNRVGIGNSCTVFCSIATECRLSMARATEFLQLPQASNPSEYDPLCYQTGMWYRTGIPVQFLQNKPRGWTRVNVFQSALTGMTPLASVLSGNKTHGVEFIPRYWSV